MALTLPANFNNDIQSRNTNLVPAVVIGSHGGTAAHHHLSTNSLRFENYGTAQPPGTNPTVYFKPLLLNIPSLKESIDLEKRNYKISNVTLDISNLPYEGQRFSELIGSASLINVE